MSKSMLFRYTLPLMAMLLAQSEGKKMPRTKVEPKIERPLTDAEKKKRHQLYSGDQTQHKYDINGVVIRATSKKVARKIYQRMEKEGRVPSHFVQHFCDD